MFPLTSARPWRVFSTYDLEWIPGTLEVRLVGCYDGNRYIRYNTVADFMNGQLVPENNGRWFFAHAGGLADVQFVFERLVHQSRYSVRASFSGSSAIIVDIRSGRYSWRFVDSYWLLRVALKKIGQWIGVDKGGPTDEMTDEQRKEWYATIDDATLEEYNELDCWILWRAIHQFEQEILELGGSLRPTLAGCSLDLFRRVYLKSELPVNVTVNKWSREAYVASRVEVIEKHVQEALYYDINSSFPFSMTKELPGELAYITHGNLPSGKPYLADVEITVPESRLPPLPYRVKHMIFFPHGSWRARFFWSDLESLIDAGGTIDKVHDVLVFEPFRDLEAFARDLYARRGTAEGFSKEVYKLLLNSLYGKFAESPLKQTLHINPPLKVLERLQLREAKLGETLDPEQPNRARMYMPGVWIEERETEVMHEHVALSAAITSHSRRLLWDHMRKARKAYYCDTDGFAVSPDTTYKTGTGLGELKLEKLIRHGYFVAPKIYSLETREGKQIFKAKGFSLAKSSERAGKQFEQLIAGREIEIERMARLRENLSRGITIPWESLRPKRLRQEQLPKRNFAADGTSEPWSVDEINKRLGVY